MDINKKYMIEGVKYNTVINGLPVEASYSAEFINDIAIPLLNELTKMCKEKGRRIVVFLAAPPGAGKSTLTEFLVNLSTDLEGVYDITGVGMDGFHHYQDYLLSHSVQRDGRDICMVDIKGAPITFDFDSLRERIEKLTSEKEVLWPIYDRPTHNPIEGKIKVSGDIVLIEGNYLLLDEPKWRDLSKLADYTISIKASKEMLRERLLERKIASGTAREKAEEFVDFSDMDNVRICLEQMMPANLELLLEAGEYKKS